MRVYRSDGTFIDHHSDNEFGWFFKDIIIDEAMVNYETINRDMRKKSLCKLQKFLRTNSEEYLDKEETIETWITLIDPKIEVYPVTNFVNCEDIMRNLSSICNAEEIRNIENEKHKLANIMNPCTIEAKTLLSVINYAKFRELQTKIISEELLKSVNFKSSNMKFILSDKQNDLDDNLVVDLMNYQQLKENNMLPLMIDIISTDTDDNFDHLTSENSTNIQQQIYPKFVIDTSDLGNSIFSSGSSQDGKFDRHFLHIPQDKSNILCSLGLSDEEKSIQSYCEETYEMYKEIASIKICFKVSTLKLLKKCNCY